MVKVLLPDFVRNCIGSLEAVGYAAYAVGGCVRDSLLGRIPKDFDVATSARPEQVRALFAKTISTGERYGTVTVLFGPNRVEVTTFRHDGKYTDRRRPDSVAFSVQIEEDLARRDFTVNAMAYHPGRGLVDPFGGMEDSANRCLRAVGDPSRRFEEDTLRIMRLFRFAAQLGFTIEQGTYLAAVNQMPALHAVSAERVAAELLRALTAADPERISPLIVQGALRPWGIHKTALDISPIQNTQQAEDVRLCALCMLTGSDTAEVCRRLRFSNRLTYAVVTLQAALCLPVPQTAPEIRRLLGNLGRELSEKLLHLQQDINRADTTKARMILDKVIACGDACSIDRLAVSGLDLLQLGIPAGKGIGRMLEQLLECVIVCPESNTREALLAYAITLQNEKESRLS